MPLIQFIFNQHLSHFCHVKRENLMLSGSAMILIHVMLDIDCSFVRLIRKIILRRYQRYQEHSTKLINKGTISLVKQSINSV